MPEPGAATVARTQPARRIVERPRASNESDLGKSLSGRMARIYGSRGIESVEQLDLSLGRMLQPASLDGAAAAAEL